MGSEISVSIDKYVTLRVVDTYLNLSIADALLLSVELELALMRHATDLTLEDLLGDL